MGQKIASITLLLSLVVAVRTEALPQYHITDLGVLPGYDYSVATAINDLGQVVGYSWYSDPTRNIRKQAFLWTREAGMIGLGFLPEGVDSSEATSINNHGVVVGTANYTYGPDQYGIFTEVGTAFRWTRDGGMQNLHSLPPGYFGSSGTAINDNGLIIAQTGNFATSRNAVISDGVAGFRQVFSVR